MERRHGSGAPGGPRPPSRRPRGRTRSSGSPSAVAGGRPGAGSRGRCGFWSAATVLVLLASRACSALGVVQKEHCRSTGLVDAGHVLARVLQRTSRCSTPAPTWAARRRARSRRAERGPRAAAARRGRDVGRGERGVGSGDRARPRARSSISRRSCSAMRSPSPSAAWRSPPAGDDPGTRRTWPSPRPRHRRTADVRAARRRAARRWRCSRGPAGGRWPPACCSVRRRARHRPPPSSWSRCSPSGCAPAGCGRRSSSRWRDRRRLVRRPAARLPEPGRRAARPPGRAGGTPRPGYGSLWLVPSLIEQSRPPPSRLARGARPERLRGHHRRPARARRGRGRHHRARARTRRRPRLAHVASSPSAARSSCSSRCRCSRRWCCCRCSRSRGCAGATT